MQQLRGGPLPVPVKPVLSIRRYVQRCSCRPARPGSRAGLVEVKDFEVVTMDRNLENPTLLQFLLSIGILGSKWDRFRPNQFNFQRERVQDWKEAALILVYHLAYSPLERFSEYKLN